MRQNGLGKEEKVSLSQAKAELCYLKGKVSFVLLLDKFYKYNVCVFIIYKEKLMMDLLKMTKEKKVYNSDIYEQY